MLADVVEHTFGLWGFLLIARGVLLVKCFAAERVDCVSRSEAELYKGIVLQYLRGC
jgi:hypothetical protein